MTANEIITKINDYRFTVSPYGSKYTSFGIRATDSEINIGDELNYSCDSNSDDSLPGTCCTGFEYLWFDGEQEDIEAVENALRINSKYLGNYRYLIAGTGSEYGNDESEEIIENAIVIAAIS